MAVKTIYSGDLKKKVTFRSPTVTRNSEGGKEITYTDAFTTRAAVSAVSSFKITEATAQALLNSKDFIIRYASDRAAINEDWQMDYYGKTYVINSIEMINEQNRFIKINAKEIG